MKTRSLPAGIGLLKQVQAAPVTINNHAVNVDYFPEPGSPVIIQPDAPGMNLGGWISENRKEVSRFLAGNGGILFRNFEVNTPERFRAFVSQLELNALKYTMRSSPRYEVSDKIYHTTTHPADQHINMHSESSYAVSWPGIAIFNCITPAAEQGETPVCDNRLVLQGIGAALREQFRNKGILYTRRLSPQLGLPWQEVFQTNNREEAEAECRRNGMHFEWQGSEKLVITWRKKAIYQHAVTNEDVWFNHGFFFNRYALDQELQQLMTDDDLPFNTSFGDGTPINASQFAELKGAYDAAIRVFPWEKGDVLYLDNMLMSHGRRPYKGERQILVSLLEPVTEEIIPFA